MKNATILLLSLLFCGCLLGQSITLKEATSQTWAGGQCCTQGINYAILLQPDAKTQTFKLDTLWIGQTAFIPDPKVPQSGQVQCLFDSLTATYQIFAGQTWGDYGQEWERPTAPIAPTIKPPHYQGEALIVYHLNGRKRRLAVKAMTELEPIDYP